MITGNWRKRNILLITDTSILNCLLRKIRTSETLTSEKLFETLTVNEGSISILRPELFATARRNSFKGTSVIEMLSFWVNPGIEDSRSLICFSIVSCLVKEFAGN